ncbi:DUF1127 domain-containing protein [Histidinibacterium lentulum]|uniref:DUF1127 domain-containing protein n=1 Tax=Histidinibacterium lentulum TaxID=2480588 RepID=A0A3N2QTJ2_9RHOB|nr:DUF1127 domain-containing protein [Histidinibacterium lentulum]ROT98546.1 DUF1127 domain-containing protein [Histidinibacterium lentulum]
MTTLTTFSGFRTTARPARHTGFFGGLRARYAQYKTYRETYEELNRLSDRDLADLDITRHQIADVASMAAYGK